MVAISSNPIPFASRWRSEIGLLLLLLAFALTGCGLGGTAKPGEVAYVSAAQATLRDRVAALFNKVGTLNNGEKVAVLERAKNGRFVRVRSARGEEGWVEQRSLVDAAVFDAFLKLARESAAAPVQARAATRAELNMHITPARDSEHLYQLKEGEKLELLRRAVAEKSPKTPGARPPQAAPGGDELPPVLEDWWLARSAAGNAGWVLGRMVDVDAPLEVAQYAEGQRIVADFVLNHVDDAGKSVPQYLLLLNEPKDGSPFDFNQLRVFTWNRRRARYETAYRERNLPGVLPARLGVEDFGSEGKLPVFSVLVRGPEGSTRERKYKLNGATVRRVLSPQEAVGPAEGKRPSRASRRQ